MQLGWPLPTSVYMLLHLLVYVSVVDNKAELVELQLHLLEHGLLDRLGAAEDLLHGHGCRQHASSSIWAPTLLVS